MKIPRSSRRRGSGLCMTPMIDVVFLLNIFFLVASHVARSSATEPVQLPEAIQHRSDDNSSPNRLVVSVMADRTLFVSGRQVTLEAVAQMIEAAHREAAQGFEVRIRADRNATYAEIEPLLTACAQAGVRKVGFAVIARTE